MYYILRKRASFHTYGEGIGLVGLWLFKREQLDGLPLSSSRHCVYKLQLLYIREHVAVDKQRDLLIVTGMTCEVRAKRRGSRHVRYCGRCFFF